MLAVLPTVTACTGSAPEPAPTSPAPTPDELALARAVATTRSLLGMGEATRSSRSAVNRLVRDVQQVNTEHLAALGVPAATGSASATGTTDATPTASAVGTTASDDAATTTTTSSRPPTVTDLVAAHAAGAQEALDDVRETSPGLATLLARLAAARALNATLLAAAAGLKAPAPPRTAEPTAPTTAVADLSRAQQRALAAQLEGEHAAVFAYALVRANLSGTRGRLADTIWEEHRARRDELERRLLAAGSEPPAARPAYDVGQVRTAQEAVALAVRIERALAQLAAADVGSLSGQARVDAAGDLVAATRRVGAWTDLPEALPGQTPPGQTPPATSASPGTSATPGTSASPSTPSSSRATTPDSP